MTEKRKKYKKIEKITLIISIISIIVLISLISYDNIKWLQIIIATIITLSIFTYLFTNALRIRLDKNIEKELHARQLEEIEKKQR